MNNYFICVFAKQDQFGNWLVDDNNCLQLALVQNALFSYQEISAHLASTDEDGELYMYVVQQYTRL